MVIRETICHLFVVVSFSAALVGCSRMPNDLPTSATAQQDSLPSEDPASTGLITDEGATPAFYSVSQYEEDRDPSSDLAMTLKRAEEEKKRVILQVGGDWCSWCARISSYMNTTPEVRKLLDQHFVVMKVAYPSDYSDAFLSKYPKIEAYPHLFVLEADGTFLHSQGTGELEKGDGYDKAIFLGFLASWAT